MELTTQLLLLQPIIPVILITGELSQPEELPPFYALVKPLDANVSYGPSRLHWKLTDIHRKHAYVMATPRV